MIYDAVQARREACKPKQDSVPELHARHKRARHPPFSHSDKIISHATLLHLWRF